MTKTYRGYEYLVLQMTMGHMCGYVKLPNSHPYFEKDYDDMDIDCHGGLTYASTTETVRHTDEVARHFTLGFWIGFDYAHSGDFTFYGRNESYNRNHTITQPFEVEQECQRVIDQLIAIENKKDDPSGGTMP